MSTWYSRPVFLVKDVERSVAFYTEKLGFTPGFQYAEDGRLVVAQVSREDCEILLDRQPIENAGHGRIFVSVDIGPLQALRQEFEGRGVPVRDGWWGYDTMIVEDPDGNALYFPYPKGSA